ncbi:MAG: nitroreductase family protein [Hymenobacteraceae bacterium]|nr:nitroreductase family protein [Hymenobacteraceae bacterium]MDX5480908.1 nitroreductase family protein [Hymenobacteraceae bacterium]
MSETAYPFVPYHAAAFSAEETEQRAEQFYELMDRRRSVREFSDKPVSRKVIEKLILTASTAPSGAHKQPWTFCAVSNADLKRQIRAAAEKEEYDSYNGRMTPEWLEDLAPLGTDWQKPFLEVAPWLIIVFKKAYDYKADGSKRNNYYVSESVGIACGFLISAIHEAGLVTLTHTPSPMNFLSRLLNRPDNERPFLLLPVGYPADEVKVPDLRRKPLDEVSVWYD